MGFNKLNDIKFLIDLLPILIFGLIWLGIIIFLKSKKKKNSVYLLFFTIFYIYLYKVLDYTLIQFQSLLLLKHFMPNLILQGQEVGKTINLIPLIKLTQWYLKTSLLNILMMIPFGFGLPFITTFRMKKTVITGFMFSLAIELIQLLTGLISGIAFRIADINDLIFNTTGVVIGYILFIVFMNIYQPLFQKWKLQSNPLLLYIAERPQIGNNRE